MSDAAAIPFTAGWIFLFILWVLMIQFRKKPIAAYKTYAVIRTILGVPLIVFAIWCGYWFLRGEIFEQGKGSNLGASAVAFIVFWVLFPPLWFFFEFYAVKKGIFTGAKADDVKDYAEFASRIWAAFLALFLFAAATRGEALKAPAPGQTNSPTSKQVQ